MKKPMNVFAVLLWLAAAVYMLLTIPTIVEILHQPEQLAATHALGSANYVASFVWRDIIAALRGAISQAGNLAGLAVIVELLDGVRSENRQRQKIT